MLWETTYNTDYPYTPYFATQKTPLKTPRFTALKPPRESLFGRGILRAKNYLKIAFAGRGKAGRGGWIISVIRIIGIIGYYLLHLLHL